MSKKLEELLDLPDSKEIIKQEKEKETKDVVAQQNDTLRDIAEMDKISAALPQVKGLGEMADTELQEVSDKAMEAYEDLMDLGMNVESRYSGRVFEVAGQMLKTNLDAKVAKLGKVDGESIVQGEGYIVTDRNSLLEKLKNMDK